MTPEPNNFPKADQPLSGSERQLSRIPLLGHDLRAAASDILGGLRLIDATSLPDTTRPQFERIRAASETLARLLEEGLQIVADQTGRGLPAAIGTKAFFYDLEMRWGATACDKGLHFALGLAPDVPPALVFDRLALERLLGNLISNAIKFTPQGHVRIFVTMTAPDRLSIEISDTGPGLEPAPRPVTDRVAALRAGGLGLLIAQDMLERLDATMQTLRSGPDGTCLQLSIPVRNCIPAAPDPWRNALAGLRGLIVEDSAAQLGLMQQMLLDSGAACDGASTGQEARKMLETGRYDFALLDIELPDMSGIELLRQWRAQEGTDTHLPMIACTAYVLRANRAAILGAGADDIIAKPVTQAGDLVRTILGAGQNAPLPEEVAQTQSPPCTRLGVLLDQLGPDEGMKFLRELENDLTQAEHTLIEGLSLPDPQTVQRCLHFLIGLARTIDAHALHFAAQALKFHVQNDSQNNGTLHRNDGQAVFAALDQLIHHIANVALLQEVAQDV